LSLLSASAFADITVNEEGSACLVYDLQNFAWWDLSDLTK